MAQSVKKILIVVVIIMIVTGVIAVIYPRLDALNGDSVEKKLFLHQTSNDPGPFYIENRGIRFKTVIAESQGEKELGLSDITSIGDDEGMLFIFDQPGYYKMWMKGMLFPLDIIWLDKNFYIIDVKKNATLDSYPETFTSNSPAMYVLEINSGLFDKYGFEIGDKFKPYDLKNDF